MASLNGVYREQTGVPFSRPEHSTVRCAWVRRHERAHRLMACEQMWLSTRSAPWLFSSRSRKAHCLPLCDKPAGSPDREKEHMAKYNDVQSSLATAHWNPQKFKVRVGCA